MAITYLKKHNGVANGHTGREDELKRSWCDVIWQYEPTLALVKESSQLQIQLAPFSTINKVEVCQRSEPGSPVVWNQVRMDSRDAVTHTTRSNAIYLMSEWICIHIAVVERKRSGWGSLSWAEAETLIYCTSTAFRMTADRATLAYISILCHMCH